MSVFGCHCRFGSDSGSAVHLQILVFGSRVQFASVSVGHPTRFVSEFRCCCRCIARALAAPVKMV